jgi:hypothetical protein
MCRDEEEYRNEVSKMELVPMRDDELPWRLPRGPWVWCAAPGLQRCASCAGLAYVRVTNASAHVSTEVRCGECEMMAESRQKWNALQQRLWQAKAAVEGARNLAEQWCLRVHACGHPVGQERPMTMDEMQDFYTFCRRLEQDSARDPV